MKGQYYKAVEIDDKGSKEPVNYVGVYPLIWSDHPEKPEMGFVEVDLRQILIDYDKWCISKVIGSIEIEEAVDMFLKTLDQ